MKDQVWWTRKARINAENRLLANQRWMELLLIWYSLVAVFTSIWLLAFSDEDQQYITFIFTCFSIFILAFSLYGANSRFSQRASQMKENYIALQQLYFLVKDANVIQREHREEYSQLLNMAENHTEIDDVRAVLHEWHKTTDKELMSRKPRAHQYVYLIYHYIIRTLFLLLLFSLPLALIIASFYGDLCAA
jgi:hypothetical protein